MKDKRYRRPEMKVLQMETEDVISTSDNDVPFPVGDGDDNNVPMTNSLQRWW